MWLRLIVNQFVQQAANEKMAAASAENERRKLRLAAIESEIEDFEEHFPPCDIAFIFALGLEAAEFATRLKEVQVTRMPGFTERLGMLGDRRVVIIESGVGKDAGATAAEYALLLHRPGWILSAGFAGGLHEDLRRGHVLMADSVADLENHQLAIGLQIDAESAKAIKGLHIGRLLTVDGVVREEAEKRRLGKEHGALACDMETMAVAAVCSFRKTRFLSVRVITDAVDDELPEEVEKLLAQKSIAGKVGAGIGALLNRPSSVKDMWALQEQANKAGARLAKFLDGVVPQL